MTAVNFKESVALSSLINIDKIDFMTAVMVAVDRAKLLADFLAAIPFAISPEIQRK